MMIAVMNNLPELIGGAVTIGVAFWLGRKSVGFNPFNWVGSKFSRK